MDLQRISKIEGREDGLGDCGNKVSVDESAYSLLKYTIALMKRSEDKQGYERKQLI